jgi:hypothetical protein
VLTIFFYFGHVRPFSIFETAAIPFLFWEEFDTRTIRDDQVRNRLTFLSMSIPFGDEELDSEGKVERSYEKQEMGRRLTCSYGWNDAIIASGLVGQTMDTCHERKWGPAIGSEGWFARMDAWIYDRGRTSYKVTWDSHAERPAH